MPTSVTDHFKLDKDKFGSTGAFDSVLDLDTRLFIDPLLLIKTKAPELKGGRKKILAHFSKILSLLEQTSGPDEATWRQAERLLNFTEARGFNFGYGGEGASGSGMGPTIRKRLLKTAAEIVSKGIKDPVIFELVGIFEEDIGCDRISDMTCRILYDEFVNFSSRVFRHCGMTAPLKNHNGQEVVMPENPFRPGHPVILVPKDILRDLPVADSWGDISHVCATNAKLRAEVNKLVGADWEKTTRAHKKQGLRKLLFENPQFFQEFIENYKNGPADTYDYRSDPSGEVLWYPRSRSYASTHALKLTLPDNPVLSDLNRVITAICERYKDAVENNGLWTLLYRDNGKTKHESASQLLFYGIACAYCDANNLAIARESNAGRGPVDFKISNGALNIVVDTKLSTNSHLMQAYEMQLPIYQRAERSADSLILVLKVREESAALKRLLVRQDSDLKNGVSGPKIIVVDALPKESASKA